MFSPVNPNCQMVDIYLPLLLLKVALIAGLPGGWVALIRVIGDAVTLIKPPHPHPNTPVPGLPSEGGSDVRRGLVRLPHPIICLSSHLGLDTSEGVGGACAYECGRASGWMTPVHWGEEGLDPLHPLQPLTAAPSLRAWARLHIFQRCNWIKWSFWRAAVAAAVCGMSKGPAL